MSKGLRHTRVETQAKAALCSQPAIEIGGLTLVPDKTRAYVEFFVSHGFPVVTVDGTAIHPQVVANSHRSMLHKVFDLAHLIRAYNPEQNARDRILGTIVGVEFPALSKGNEAAVQTGRWGVPESKGLAPGIRGVAVIHKQAEQAERILATWFGGEVNWTVSMEQDYFLESSGFVVRGRKGVEEWEEKTPEDLRGLGWVYVPAMEAPMELLKCMEAEESKITKAYKGQEVVVLFGGLDGQVHYKGVGLTPLGKEAEARVSQMLASAAGSEVLEELQGGLVQPLKKTLSLFQEK